MNLAERYSIDTVRANLPRPGEWHPYPTIDDAHMTPVWGDFITRILLRARSPTRSGVFSVKVHAG